MRRLFRRRDRARRGGLVIGLALALAASLVGPAPAVAAETAVPSVSITSPLGRTGLADTVRIVARVAAPSGVAPTVVRFYMDGTLLGLDVDGPPYVMEWADANPFERCALAVEATFADGVVVRDEVVLEPFEFVESAHVMSVSLDATVQDARGRYVPDLTTVDFELREDGVVQSIVTASVESLPTTFALLIDASQSMSRSMPLVRQAASGFSDHLRGADTVLVAPFKGAITTVTGPTRDRVTLENAVAAIRPEGTTAILDALAAAAERFVAGNRRVIVLVTDGYDERSQHPLERALAALKRADVTVHVVAIGGVAGVSLHGEALIRRVAAETGGRAFFPWNAAELAAVHKAIAEDAHSRYRLGYTPLNQRHDGAFRRIQLTVKEPGFQVRTRAGFTAPAPPPVRVSMEFTAVSDSREYLHLSREQVHVTEDGVPQTLDAFHEAVAPVSIMLALDGSGSMKRATPRVQEAVRAFVAALRPADALGMVVFADAPLLAHGFSLDRGETERAIADYSARGGTALYDALDNGFAQLSSREGRRVLVVVSDGRDENAASTGPGSRTSWDAIVGRARDSDATVYAIGLGSRVDAARLRQLAAITGGEAYIAANVSELEGHYARIVEELRRRYVVSYTSTNSARDGGWRKVEIRTEEGVQLRSRGGYVAPSDQGGPTPALAAR